MKTTLLNRVFRSAPMVVAGLSWGLVQSSSAALLWTSGHGDIGVALEDEGEGPELHLHLHLGEGEPAIVGGAPYSDTEFDASEVDILMDNPMTIGSTDPELLGGLGTTTGSTVYLLPASGIQASSAGVPFVGFGTEELEVVDWGSIEFRLDSVVGPSGGEFSIYQAGGTGGFVFAMSTADGIDGSDVLTMNPGGHDHYNIAFTEPGTYEVTLTATGVHSTLGELTSTETFTFTSVPEPSSVLFLGLSGLLAFRRQRRS